MQKQQGNHLRKGLINCIRYTSSCSTHQLRSLQLRSKFPARGRGKLVYIRYRACLDGLPEAGHQHRHEQSLLRLEPKAALLSWQNQANAAIFAIAAFANSAAAAETLQPATKYVPTPYNPGWEIWVGFAAGVIPFLIGGWEFGKRIIIQQQCERCKGSGLVPKRAYKSERDVRKCPECGGFFPWQGWKNFFLSTAAPGNGGPLMAPKNQSSMFYRVPSKSESGGGGERPDSDDK